MISLRIHNIIDYIVGAVLLISPWLFGFADIAAARNIFLVGGVLLIAYSLFTKYYYSISRVLPLGVHMTMDALLGILLILAPALFGYRDVLTQGQYAAHIILGVAAVGLVALTRPRTEAAKTPAERAEIAHEAPLAH